LFIVVVNIVVIVVEVVIVVRMAVLVVAIVVENRHEIPLDLFWCKISV